MFVIYNVNTTQFARLWRNGYWQDAKYATETAAKAGFTRLEKKGVVNLKEFAIAEYNDFVANIEKTEEVTNMMSGKKVRQSVNTPRCCDVSSELHWSM